MYGAFFNVKHPSLSMMTKSVGRAYFMAVCCSFLFSTVVESNKRCKQIRELVITESQNKPLSVLQLLMNAAKLELKLREVEV